MIDKKGYKIFTQQVDVLDVLWLDEKTGIALCDDGSDEDMIYLLKDNQTFSYQRLFDRNTCVKFLGCIVTQLLKDKK
jgi:hypothetical protein